MKWIRLKKRDGEYMSDDGEFLVSKIKARQWEVRRRRAVEGNADVPWEWSPMLMYAEGKRELQEAAERDELATVAPRRVVAVESREDVLRPVPNWQQCVECTVPFVRDERHKFDDYCGENCVEIVEERLAEMGRKPGVHHQRRSGDHHHGKKRKAPRSATDHDARRDHGRNS